MKQRKSTEKVDFLFFIFIIMKIWKKGTIFDKIELWILKKLNKHILIY